MPSSLSIVSMIERGQRVFLFELLLHGQFQQQ
jgi:hypothetical protein